MPSPVAEGEEESQTADAPVRIRKTKRLWVLVIFILTVVLLYTGISALVDNSHAVKATVVTNSGKTRQMTLEEIRSIANDQRELFLNEYAGAEITVTSQVSYVGGEYALESGFSC